MVYLSTYNFLLYPVIKITLLYICNSSAQIPIIAFDGLHENEGAICMNTKNSFLSNFMHSLVMSIRSNRKISNGMKY